jgi:hypothetical protein
MRPAGYPDCLIVVNGPEDGAEFPVVRAPFHIGRDSACGANLRLDIAVRPFHALVSVVSDGYRVRRTERAPVYVDGKRAGMIRSRLLRSGGTLQVGDTQLVLECAPDGLASRSHGLVHESDLAWFLRFAGRKALRIFTALLSLVMAIGGRILGSRMAIIAILVLMYFFVPPFHAVVNRFFAVVYYKIIMAVLERIFTL